MCFGVFERGQLSNTLLFTPRTPHTQRVILLSVVWLCELIVLRWKCQRIGVTLKHTHRHYVEQSAARVREYMLHIWPLSFNKNCGWLLLYSVFSIAR